MPLTTWRQKAYAHTVKEAWARHPDRHRRGPLIRLVVRGRVAVLRLEPRRAQAQPTGVETWPVGHGTCQVTRSVLRATPSRVCPQPPYELSELAPK